MDGQAEWESRRFGVLKLAPQQPALENLLQGSHRHIAERLQCSQDQTTRVVKLLRGLERELRQVLYVKDIFYSGSLTRRTALNYDFDSDVVCVLHNFDAADMTEYMDDCERHLYDNFRRPITVVRRTPFCIQLVLGDFVDVDLVITGDPSDSYGFSQRRRRYYSGFGSQSVDAKILKLEAANSWSFRPLVLLCKHWKNLKPEAHTVKSFFIELTCMEVIKANASDSINDLFREFLTWLADGHSSVANLNPYNPSSVFLSSDTAWHVQQHAASTLKRYRAYLRAGNCFSCPACGVTRFLDAAGAVQHLESGRCPHCPNAQTARGKIYGFMQSHEEAHHFLNPMLTNGANSYSADALDYYSCPHCRKSFHQLSSLLNHIKSKHGQNQPYLAIRF